VKLRFLVFEFFFKFEHAFHDWRRYHTLSFLHKVTCCIYSCHFLKMQGDMHPQVSALRHRGSNAVCPPTFSFSSFSQICFSCKQNSNWASVSLGLFLCITHAGQHRSYGTHISSVRSLDLDSWTDKNIMFLEVGMPE
jgi:hypothetical protein